MSKKDKNLGIQISAPIHYAKVSIRNLNVVKKIQPMIKTRVVLATQSGYDYPTIFNKYKLTEPSRTQNLEFFFSPIGTCLEHMSKD